MSIIGSSTCVSVCGLGSLPADNAHYVNPLGDPTGSRAILISGRCGRTRVIGFGTRNPSARDTQGRPSSVARGVLASFLASSASAKTEPPKRARLRPSSPDR